mgnify:CR=1 FL=1
MLLLIHRKPNQRGFTQLEMVMVVVIMGVLAVFIAPSFNNNGSGSYGNIFYARGFHDETLALLRFGQKSAIAQRRTVCVEFFGAVNVSLRIAASAASPTCTNDLQGPSGGNAASITAQSDVAYSAIPSNFSFDGLGQPVDGLSAPASTKSIQVLNASKTITVEAITGYVHD